MRGSKKRRGKEISGRVNLENSYSQKTGGIGKRKGGEQGKVEREEQT